MKRCVLALLLLCGCATVPVRHDSSHDRSIIDTGRCVETPHGRQFTLTSHHRHWFFVFGYTTWFVELDATVPVNETQGAATVRSFGENKFPYFSGTGTATVEADGAKQCVTVNAELRRAGRTEEKVGLPGSNFELGPWCVRECPAEQ